MSSTTIRYSTLPENSQPIDFGVSRPSHAELEYDLHGELDREPVRGPDHEHDRELDLASVGLHFERHRADPEPEVPASRVPRSRASGRGVPDPNTPGAYRYDPADPSTCDPHLPDSDPRSPRYEPPHLRHRPGDTFEIGGKPHDPLDPGPYGSPGWFQDRRTGRHRRGELPDPLPEDDRPMPVPSPAPVPIPSPAPPIDEPRPHPYRRHRRWDEPEPDQTGPHQIDAPYRFSPLREGAMQRFLELSQPFRDAHFQPQPPSLAERLVWVLRWVLWIVTCGLRPVPSPLTVESEPVLVTATDVEVTGTQRLTVPLPVRLPAVGGGL